MYRYTVFVRGGEKGGKALRAIGIVGNPARANRKQIQIDDLSLPSATTSQEGQFMAMSCVLDNLHELEGHTPAVVVVKTTSELVLGSIAARYPGILISEKKPIKINAKNLKPLAAKVLDQIRSLEAEGIYTHFMWVPARLMDKAL